MLWRAGAMRARTGRLRSERDGGNVCGHRAGRSGRVSRGLSRKSDMIAARAPRQVRQQTDRTQSG
jgi:hypothetical protein